MSDRVADALRDSGISRTKELEALGYSRTQIRRLVERGEVEQVSRGLYSLPGTLLSERQQLAEAAKRVPAGVFCLFTALRFHGLTTQNPREIWIAIEAGAWRPRVASLTLHLVHLSGASLSGGIEAHDIAGVPVRVYAAAKTVADCFKFRNRIGLDVALEALRDYRRVHPKRLGELWTFAQANRVGRIMQPYLDALA